MRSPHDHPVLSDHGEGSATTASRNTGCSCMTKRIHVPLIVQAGGQRRRRTARRAIVVQHIDIVPTLLDFVKAPIPGQLRGRSSAPLLEGTGKLTPSPGILRSAVRALSLRLERADGADRRPLSIHQGAA